MPPLPGERLAFRASRVLPEKGNAIVCGLGAYRRNGSPKNSGDLVFRHATYRKVGEFPDLVLGPAVASR